MLLEQIKIWNAYAEANIKREEEARIASAKFWLAYNIELAKSYFAAGKLDEAINSAVKIQETFVNTPSSLVNARGAVYPQSFLLIGKAYEEKGAIQQAIENYELLVELWKNADEDLPDLIDAKARLARLKENSK